MMIIKTENDLRRCAEAIWRESIKLSGENLDGFPKDDRWVITNRENGESFLRWNTGLTAIFRQGGNYTIPVEVVWEMPQFYAWYFSDDTKIMRLWHGFVGFLLRILGDPKRIEGGLEFVDVVSQPQPQNKTEEEEPRWKQRRRNIRSDFPLK